MLALLRTQTPHSGAFEADADRFEGTARTCQIAPERIIMPDTRPKSAHWLTSCLFRAWMVGSLKSGRFTTVWLPLTARLRNTAEEAATLPEHLFVQAPGGFV